jgi:DNA-binding response OmpR family regulator
LEIVDVSNPVQPRAIVGFDAIHNARALQVVGQLAYVAGQYTTVSGLGLVVMDVLMPRLDGRETLRRLRRMGNWTPVILLTQVGEATERAMALEEGADDYLNKPFEPHELVARIRAVLRRASLNLPPLSAAWTLVSGELRLDRRSRRAYLAKRELALTPKALILLEYLMTHPDPELARIARYEMARRVLGTTPCRICARWPVPGRRNRRPRKRE